MEMHFWWGFAFAIQGSEQLCLLRAEEEEAVGMSSAGSAPQTAAAVPTREPQPDPPLQDSREPEEKPLSALISPYQGMRGEKSLKNSECSFNPACVRV